MFYFAPFPLLAYISLQILQFLLMEAQKYFLPRSASYPSYTTAHDSPQRNAASTVLRKKRKSFSEKHPFSEKCQLLWKFQAIFVRKKLYPGPHLVLITPAS